MATPVTHAAKKRTATSTAMIAHTVESATAEPVSVHVDSMRPMAGDRVRGSRSPDR